MPENDAGNETLTLLGEYEQFLSGKARGTIDAYLRTARHLMGWVARLPGEDGSFEPQQLTKVTVELYLAHLEQEGFSLSHRARVRSSISTFASFLIEETGLLQRNPTRSIELLPIPLPASQLLSHEQRRVLRALVKQAGDQRGAALFALGYWAGCRVSELSWLKMADTHVGREKGWLHVGTKEGTQRDITLLNSARKPLYAYLEAMGDRERTYVFLSQRSERLTEEAIHYWFRTLKAGATEGQGKVIGDITWHDVRYDFASRAREAGWSLEEVAFYLGVGTTQ